MTSLRQDQRSSEPTLVTERPQLNTHNVLIDFGKHKGEPWTRLPISYLKWMLNEMSPDSEKYQMAESELNRRGDTMPREIEISNHAIDKASLRVRKAWHTDRGEDEGIYSWLVRISTEALEIKNNNGAEQNERVNYKGCKLIFTYGNFFPTLKTVMNDKSYTLPSSERLSCEHRACRELAHSRGTKETQKGAV